MLAIREPDDRQRARGLLQKGIRERLFCEECEQRFNEHFENPSSISGSRTHSPICGMTTAFNG